MFRGMLYNAAKKDSTDGGRGVPKATVGQNEPRLSTAATLAKQLGVDPSTIKRDGKYAEAVETLGMEEEVARG